jgi:hypothetical protein
MELQQEIHRTGQDIHLLMFERMRMIDAMNWWQHCTLKQYAPHLKYLYQFDGHYGVRSLSPSKLAQPPRTPVIPIMWSLLNSSLRLMTNIMRSHVEDARISWQIWNGSNQVNCLRVRLPM